MQRNSSNGADLLATAAAAHGACAACKHQRKKCDENCVLAPLFPADRGREFQGVLKMYGVSNVQKLVKTIDDERDRRNAANSLVWEASCREKDPVWGALGENRKVCEELKQWKALFMAGMAPPPTAAASVGWNGGRRNNGNSVSMGMGMGGGGNNAGYVHHHQNNGNNSILDRSAYGFPSQQVQEKGIRKQEREVASSPHAVQVPQQHPVNGFHHHPPFYISGQFSTLDSKSMESSIWEAGS